MDTMQQHRPLNLMRWYRSAGWARRRAVAHATRRHVPILLISHPLYGFAAVSERLYPMYEPGCSVVERVEAS